jgi:hypothetical protein
MAFLPAVLQNLVRRGISPRMRRGGGAADFEET